jgi:hypothetical protein
LFLSIHDYAVWEIISPQTGAAGIPFKRGEMLNSRAMVKSSRAEDADPGSLY